MTRLGYIDVGDMLFSVIALSDTGGLMRPTIYGTAFCVGPGIFITAGHVLENIAADGGHVGLGKYMENGTVGAVKVANTEILRSHDIGVILARAEAPALLDWASEPRSFLADVSAAGFPYAVNAAEDPPSFKVTMRAFKGSVITRTALWKLPAQPVGYEISCAFPKGMSGAPLLDATPPIPDLTVLGVVLASGEVEAYGETTRFGVALDILELQNLRSEIIVGGTFGELRAAALSDDDFQFKPDRPFLNWPRRRPA